MVEEVNKLPRADAQQDEGLTRKPLSRDAQAALAEAEARRSAMDAQQARPVEHQGRGGLEPVRYGDWEIKGLASDF